MVLIEIDLLRETLFEAMKNGDYPEGSHVYVCANTETCFDA
jgi:hypothetical protein